MQHLAPTDLVAARISIEQLCLRRSIEKGDVEWETDMVAAYHRLRRMFEQANGWAGGDTQK